jgi:hypothetical protein
LAPSICVIRVLSSDCAIFLRFLFCTILLKD